MIAFSVTQGACLRRANRIYSECHPSRMGVGGYSLRARRSSRVPPRVLSACSPSCSDSSAGDAASKDDKADSDYFHETGDVKSESESDSGKSSSYEEDKNTFASPRRSSRTRQISKKRKRARETSTSETLDGSFPSTSTLASFSRDDISLFRSLILRWYVSNYRDLPWRVEPRFVAEGPAKALVKPEKQCSPGAPYAVWVSEIMSQQTRISVVVDYWKRWMVAFPTIEALANASMERVNELWSGLGYYRRCRFLHEASQQIVSEFDGNLPDTVEQLLAIKGIGRYTAGAIVSIAFNVPAPAVDGNVERILARLRPGVRPNREPSITPGAKAKAYEQLAGELVADIETPGDFNQAMMELGATVCTPRSPSCSSCPVQSLCGTFEEASSSGVTASKYAERYPVKDVSRKVKVRDEVVFVCVVRRVQGSAKEYLLIQRPEGGLLAGLWESPSVVFDPVHNEEISSRTRMRRFKTYVGDVLAEAGFVEHDFPCPNLDSVGETNHVFSHIRQKILVQSLTVQMPTRNTGTLKDGRDFRWLSENDITQSAVATQMRKALKLAFRYYARIDKE